MKKIVSLFLCLGLLQMLYGQELDLCFTLQRTSWADTPDTLSGRLFLVFAKTKSDEVFTGIYYPDLKMNPVFAVDVENWTKDAALSITGKKLYGFPTKTISQIAAGEWFVHAVLKPKGLNPYLYEGGTLYSKQIAISIEATAEPQHYQLSLSSRIDAEKTPVDTKHFRYGHLPSPLLTAFWDTPISSAYQVVVPRSYHSNGDQRYPLLVIIGGFGGRYYQEVIKEKELLAEDTPEMIILVVDSQCPYGDSYQMNSANNGPYGDVLIQELIPYIESKYRCMGTPTGRFLTGTSTGGWSSLALQIFYPDFFNGVWSTCADPVDFRQMELINLYEDPNAFLNQHGLERPGMRDINGEPRYTVRTEVWAENVLGRQNSYAQGRGAWGSWNAIFSPRDSLTGLPQLIFDPETGIINPTVAEAWKKYDLRLHLANNWETLGPKLAGKLHIWMGTMDSYYLNNAMALFDEFLKSTRNPQSDADIHFICGEGHACDASIPLTKMMQQMVARAQFED